MGGVRSSPVVVFAALFPAAFEFDSGDDLAQQLQHLDEIDLGLGHGQDPRQPGLPLAVPRARPPDRMHGGVVAGVAASQSGSQCPRFLEHGVFGWAPCRGLQPVVQVQFGLDLAGLLVDCRAAAFLHHQRQWAEQRFQLGPRRRCALVAFGRQCQPLGQILFARLFAVGEGRTGGQNTSFLRSFAAAASA